ncbi:hypothetical protein GE21DRAFT_6221 [Neurospora crassa]|uniref:Uncharacterized protein n=1 Tax=Neurospora crassa (strain ATCC 24698 / 74-OR23-1A / CBS 708.71 / DSM 1257 / FGSC 987) TaxID=367110 RepID=V5IMF9_NEUCR|nr:hypothetical protein NCU16825 [Neurospora crassa OR74A]ESA42978.1 hypothetical protein NCU16825 [Neurospora crassa OR74A]KHE84438.1 hypothetical protein GE21DRAFT_6221 [Neurospora crassa]|eukprot:XP_011394411.1 hypothetical protein NCU16825 [Neurospora crassa OR74A]
MRWLTWSWTRTSHFFPFSKRELLATRPPPRSDSPGSVLASSQSFILIQSINNRSFGHLVRSLAKSQGIKMSEPGQHEMPLPTGPNKPGGVRYQRGILRT